MSATATGNMFKAKNVKLKLPGKIIGNPSKIQGWIFKIEQYCELVGSTADHDEIKLAITLYEKRCKPSGTSSILPITKMLQQ